MIRQVMVLALGLGLSGVAAAGKADKKAEAEPAPAPEPPAMERTLSSTSSYARKVLQTCSPEGVDLIGREVAITPEQSFRTFGAGGLDLDKQVNVGPPADPSAAIKGERPIDVLLGLPSGLRASAMSYAFRSPYQALRAQGSDLSFATAWRNLYLGPEKQLLLAYTPVFSASVLAATTPTEQRGPRYGVLSSDGRGGGAPEGIYAIAGALAASAMEARVAVDLLSCGWENTGMSSAQWLDLFTSVEGALLAREELRLYALRYLAMAHSADAEVYTALVKNPSLLQALQGSDARYAAIEDDYVKRANGVIEALKAQGIDGAFSDNDVRVGEQIRRRFTEKRAGLRAAAEDPALAAEAAVLQGN